MKMNVGRTCARWALPLFSFSLSLCIQILRLTHRFGICLLSSVCFCIHTFRNDIEIQACCYTVHPHQKVILISKLYMCMFKNIISAISWNGAHSKHEFCSRKWVFMCHFLFNIYSIHVHAHHTDCDDTGVSVWICRTSNHRQTLWLGLYKNLVWVRSLSMAASAANNTTGSGSIPFSLYFIIVPIGNQIRRLSHWTPSLTLSHSHAYSLSFAWNYVARGHKRFAFLWFCLVSV